LVELLGLIGQYFEPLQADLERQGKKFNLVGMFQRIWREGMGERGADSLIADLTPEEQLQAMARQIAQAQAQAEAAAQGNAGRTRKAAGNQDELEQRATEDLDKGFQ
jgi:hypothetical protein